MTTTTIQSLPEPIMPMYESYLGKRTPTINDTVKKLNDDIADCNKNLNALKNDVKNKDKEIAELKKEIRDVMDQIAVMYHPGRGSDDNSSRKKKRKSKSKSKRSK
tara:strand:- start:295 stop:609 length:315 start_codon:yes stop_codon:yes gene_type:complete